MTNTAKIEIMNVQLETSSKSSVSISEKLSVDKINKSGKQLW